LCHKVELQLRGKKLNLGVVNAARVRVGARTFVIDLPKRTWGLFAWIRASHIPNRGVPASDGKQRAPCERSGKSAPREKNGSHNGFSSIEPGRQSSKKETASKERDRVQS
jgi:hypothetical protein